MKIIGFIEVEGNTEMVLKGDSCLLNNRKPFFVPEGANDIRMTPCVVLRVSRLGKHIAPKFSDRYFDAWAAGADFMAYDVLQTARQEGRAWTQSLCFDYSLAVGEWHSTEEVINKDLLIDTATAIAQASSLMTIRQGDLIYIQQRNGRRPVAREELIEDDGLCCKVK
ncbi:MAG: hypothetical protein ACI4BD_02860 [Paludibacteraceae bacterium]